MNDLKSGDPLPELTQRQLQILKLLQAGKVNKEVAEELGIGLGTVKQHIVAIFKKLNVKNRAMAASQGMEIFQNQEARNNTLTVNMLACRPCVVLSMALPADCQAVATKLMYGSLAALASNNEAVFLARNGNAGDLIFGVQQVTEYDIALALQAARLVYEDIAAGFPDAATQLRGSITAGIAYASMHRFGGWTGEAIASSAIASARDLLNTVAPGQFLFDATARELLELFGLGATQDIPSLMPFANLKNLYWTGTRRPYHLVGRVSEMAQLFAALHESAKQQGKLIILQGEMGMGKSSLCDAIARLCQQQNGTVAYYRKLPARLGEQLFDTAKAAQCSVDEIIARLRTPPAQFPSLLIVDDYPLLATEQQEALFAAAGDAVRHGQMVIFSGRKWLRSSPVQPAQVISLRRLNAQSTQELVRNALGKDAVKERASKVQRITTQSAGVPLFAVELARHHDEERLTLPLRVAINARLDSLHLDQRLLREVAKNSVGANLNEVAAALQENIEGLQPQVERAIASGVLTGSPEGWLSFSHPLLRQAIDNLIVEQS